MHAPSKSCALKLESISLVKSKNCRTESGSLALLADDTCTYQHPCILANCPPVALFRKELLPELELGLRKLVSALPKSR